MDKIFYFLILYLMSKFKKNLFKTEKNTEKTPLKFFY